MRQLRYRFVSIVILSFVLTAVCACAPKPEAGPVDLDIGLEMEVGKDIGQSLGTLFTLEDGAGNVVMGAGFADVYNSYKRSNHRNLNVFIVTDRPGVFETLERPFPETTAIRLLMNIDGSLIATDRQTGERKKLEAEGSWSDYTEMSTFGSSLQLNNRHLELGYYDIVYDGESIMENTPAESFIPYYVDGRLYIYATGEEQTLYVCAWEYDDPELVDINACEKHEMGYELPQFPYSFGQYENEVLFNMNYGDRYSYADGVLTMIHDAGEYDDQIYSLLHSDGRVYAGQYPSGSVLVYEGGNDYETMTPNIEVPEGFFENSREAQSLQLYAGYMYAGVWPNGELHQYDFNHDSWEYLGRLFTHPDVTRTNESEPYRSKLEAIGFTTDENLFGQRLNDLALVDEYMYIATSNKAGAEYDEAWGFLTEEQLAEYGSVVRYQKDYNLTCQFTWPDDGETTIQVTLDESKLVVYQDSTEVCSLSVDLSGITIDESTLSLGEGMFGSYREDGLTLLD